MSELKNIVRGWFNYIKAKRPAGLSPELEKLSFERAAICKECPSLLKEPVIVCCTKISRFKCKECGCAFPQMVYAPDKKCNLNKWP